MFVKYDVTKFNMKVAQTKKHTLRFIKKDLKFMDFGHFTNAFCEKNLVPEKKRKQLTIRIHNFVPHIFDTIRFYHTEDGLAKFVIYQIMEIRFKEFVRRMKISFARNKSNYKLCLDYYNSLIEVLQKDAKILKDWELLDELEAFKQRMNLIQVK